MTKLKYPEEGMMMVCRGNIEDAGNHLSGAFSDAAFDIPSDFPERDYLYELGGRINDFRERLNNIGVKIQNTDRNLHEMSNELRVGAGSLAISRLQKRDRMIV